ncbi:MAG: polyketide cyclase [Flavobacteriales bacterium]|nr:polyketide cyclase [Flavobacteriales bacterium]
MTITISTTVDAPIAKAWEVWTKPEFIVQWNFASDDWCCPSAVNDLRPNGKFSWRMEAKDGSFGFDYGGDYVEVLENERIEMLLGDGRKVEVLFAHQNGQTIVTESFETEDVNSAEMQKQGWSAILGNYKKCVEANA